MRKAAVGAGTAVLAGLLLTQNEARHQDPAPEPAFVAFRVDEHRVIATIRVMEPMAKQVREGLSAEPVARFGYQHFELPASWRERVPAGIRDAKRWVVHAAPGQAFDAEAERIVGGNAQCTEAVGVLLRIDAPRAAAFAALPARYFVADASVPRDVPAAGSRSPVRVLSSPALTVEQRRAFESILNQVLMQELPRVRADAEPHRVGSRARTPQRREIDEALARGHGELRYDIQSFQLAPDGVPLHFVRAEWSVQRRQGFAVSLWMRGEQPIEIIQTNLRPASWLRMSLFQGKVAPEHLGLVLNVLDRDHDGWGEVLMSQDGYEGRSIQLFEYSPSGFQPTGTEFACGC